MCVKDFCALKIDICYPKTIQMIKARNYIFSLLFFSFLISPLFGSIPVEKGGDIHEFLRVENFIRYTIPEFEQASGHKLGFLQKIYFKKLQKKIKKSGLPAEFALAALYDTDQGKFKLNTLWFILGVFIGPFAVLFAFLAKERAKGKGSESKKNVRLSVIIGMGIFFIWFGYIFLF